MRIATGGFSWVAGFFLITILLSIGSIYSPGSSGGILLAGAVVSLLGSFLLLVFFRDPERTIADGIVAVADGRIREITQENDNDIGECTKISTFMNIYHVHVNRMPLDGTITTVTHYNGKHLPAFKKESERNERVVIIAETKIGAIKIVQIAGTLARRIYPYIHKEDTVKKGDRIGLIKLGSRVDVYLPTKNLKQMCVSLHDHVKAGVDTIAKPND